MSAPDEAAARIHGVQEHRHRLGEGGDQEEREDVRFRGAQGAARELGIQQEDPGYDTRPRHPAEVIVRRVRLLVGRPGQGHVGDEITGYRLAVGQVIKY